MESREDGGGTPPIVAHTLEEEFTSITAAMRDGHSMAGRETTSTDSDSDSDVDPVPREWKKLSRANGTGRFEEAVALRESEKEVDEGINEPGRGHEGVFSNIGRWGDSPEIAQAWREKKTRDMSQGTVINNLPPVPFDPEVDAPAHVRFQCWGPGHGWPQCPKGRRWEYCTNCGRCNVSINTCPRCAKLHRAFIEEKYGEKRRRRRSRRQRRGESNSGAVLDRESDSPTDPGTERDRSHPRPRPALERRASPPIVPRRSVQERLGPRWMEPEQRDREERILEFFRRIQDLPRGLRIHAIREFFGTDPGPGERE